MKSSVALAHASASLAGKRYSSAIVYRAYWLMAPPAARDRPEVKTFMAWLANKVEPLAALAE